MKKGYLLCQYRRREKNKGEKTEKKVGKKMSTAVHNHFQLEGVQKIN